MSRHWKVYNRTFLIPILSLLQLLHFFFLSQHRLGLIVARNPWKVIGISLLISALCIIGVLNLQTENRGEKNWVSQSSDPVKHKDWIDKVFPIPSRAVNLFLERSDRGNILTRDGLLELYKVDQMVKAMLNTTAEQQWSDICYTWEWKKNIFLRMTGQ